MKRLLPAYPLFVKDPFFSIWMPGDVLNESDTVFWNGSVKKTFGRVIADGKAYTFLGKTGDTGLVQTDVRVTAYSTEYDFSCAEFDFSVSFISPLPPEDLKMLSCPVCYMDYQIRPKKKINEFKVMLSFSEEYCYDIETARRVLRDETAGGTIGGRKRKTAWFGRKVQPVLSKIGDSCSADWGYFYLEGDEAYYHTYNTVSEIIAGKTPAFIGDDGKKMITAVNRHSGEKLSGTILAAFDDIQSINYYGNFLKGYFFKDGLNIFGALDYAAAETEKVKALDRAATDALRNKSKPYGEAYFRLLTASLRQSVAAHKLVEEMDGRLLFLSKECHSNGCIATVDVSYPSMPLYLMTNPELVRGMLEPIFDFAAMPCWEYDFAPHDAGCYPYCCGQVYGMNGSDKTGGDVYPNYSGGQGTFYPVYQYPAGNNLYNFEYQMPVEECSNMLIMTMLYHKYSYKKDKAFLEKNFALMNKWVDYLTEYGFCPEKQLCTDDFAGHLAKNVNLSIKASLGIQAFALIAKELGKTQMFKEFDKISRGHASKLMEMYKSAAATPLAMDLEGESYGLKYNLAIDVLFGSKLYSEEFLERETDYYIEKTNKYGVPLDTRADYTKSDWIVWAAALTKDKGKSARLVAPIAAMLDESESRVPFTDWYDTKTGKQCGFQNRTVQGGIFFLLLKDMA